MSANRRPGYLAKVLAIALAAVAVVYIAVAYAIVPALWSDYERQPGLAARPSVTVTAQGIPGDPLNVGLVGSRNDVMRAMVRAGWHPADPVTLRSGLEIGLSVVLDRSYDAAPVSALFYEGRRQDLAFELPVGRSPARRHHMRLWLVLANGAEGREVWLGAASFDRGVGLSHDTGQITHHIDADVDAERDFVMGSLADAGVLDGIYRVPGVGPTLNGRNGGGDLYFTDGEVLVGVLVPKLAADTVAMPKPAPPAVQLKKRIWGAVVAIARTLRIIPLAQA